MEYPIALKIKNRKCLVVGGGRVALRKVKGLLHCGAQVGVVSREIKGEMRSLLADGQIRYLGPRYHSSQLNRCLLVFAATDSASLNAQISRDARRKGLLVNAADRPELCSFHLPAVLRRGSVSIGITTGGKSPALARELKEYLERNLPRDLGDAAVFLGRMRPLVRQKYPDQQQRAVVFKRMAKAVLSSLAKKRSF